MDTRIHCWYCLFQMMNAFFFDITMKILLICYCLPSDHFISNWQFIFCFPNFYFFFFRRVLLKKIEDSLKQKHKIFSKFFLLYWITINLIWYHLFVGVSVSVYYSTMWSTSSLSLVSGKNMVSIAVTNAIVPNVATVNVIPKLLVCGEKLFWN